VRQWPNEALNLTGAALRFRAACGRCSGPGKLACAFGPGKSGLTSWLVIGGSLMSLGITVGRLASCLRAGDEEVADSIRQELREVNRVLIAHHLPAHVEPESLPPLRRRSRLDHMPYSWHARLLRAVAFSRQAPEAFEAAGEGEDALRHPHVRAELALRGSQLICQGAEGYFVPADFPQSLFDARKRLPGGVLGSSPAAAPELAAVAPLLGIRLARGKLAPAAAEEIDKEEGGPYYEERQAWLILFESFRLGIEHRASVCFHCPLGFAPGEAEEAEREAHLPAGPMERHVTKAYLPRRSGAAAGSAKEGGRWNSEPSHRSWRASTGGRPTWTSRLSPRRPTWWAFRWPPPRVFTTPATPSGGVCPMGWCSSCGRHRRSRRSPMSRRCRTRWVGSSGCRKDITRT